MGEIFCSDLWPVTCDLHKKPAVVDNNFYQAESTQIDLE